MYTIYLPTLLFLATFGLFIVLCNGMTCKNPDQEKSCQYGCCNGNDTQDIPTCCKKPADKKSSIPAFSIFFYALVAGLALLLIVGGICKYYRNTNTRPKNVHGTANINNPRTHIAQSVVNASVELVLQVRQNRATGENRSRIREANENRSAIIQTSENRPRIREANGNRSRIIQTSENRSRIIQTSENRSRVRETNDIDSTDAIQSEDPPTYDKAMRRGTSDSPPSYETICNFSNIL